MRLKKEIKNVCLKISKRNRTIKLNHWLSKTHRSFGRKCVLPAWYYCSVFFSAPGKSNMFFFRMALKTSYPALGISCMYAFALLALITGFPAFYTGPTVFSRLATIALYPALALVRCFPALGTGNTFSRAWHWLHCLVSNREVLGTSLVNYGISNY